MRWLIALCVPSIAWAQLPDTVPAEQIPDGFATGVVGSALGETAPRREDQLSGELSLFASWTRAGLDDTEGLRGPRWTNRWGAALTLRAASGSGERPLDLEERAELALYLGSIGQSVRWQSQPRLTDRFWNRTTEQLELGAFADFGGIGMIKHDPDGDMSAEGFPIHAEVTRTFGDGEPITTTRFDIAIARVANQRGDMRIIDESIVVQRGPRPAAAIDAAFFSARSVEVTPHSPWRLSGAIGISAILPGSTDLEAGSAGSYMPLVRIGIEHRSVAQLRSTRSEIGRPLVDNTDFGVELANLHRSTETTVDAGGQLTAWWQRALTAQLDAYGEAMLGIAHHQLDVNGAMSTPAHGFIVIARGELGVTAKLGAGFSVDTRAWAEHSDRAAPMLPARWDVALSSGLTFRR